MKTNNLKNLAACVAAASLTLTPFPGLAQDSSTNTRPAVTTAQADSATIAPAAPAAAPQLAYGVGQILQLSQAKVGDDTIVAYIRNSGNSYGLNADQIIYLRQQGLSSAVLNAMLSHPAPGVLNSAPAVPLPSTPAPAVSYPQPVASSSTVGPSVSAIDPSAAAAAATAYYYQPYYYSSYPYYTYPCYYPAYGFYPGVSVSFGWGGRWGGWGGYHGGWGGYHGGWGGGFHGGWHH